MTGHQDKDTNTELLQSIFSLVKDLKANQDNQLERIAKLEIKDTFKQNEISSSVLPVDSLIELAIADVNANSITPFTSTIPVAQPDFVTPPSPNTQFMALTGSTTVPTPLVLNPTVQDAKKDILKFYNQRIILTTYPNQVGIKPISMNWGASDAKQRGPVIASRHKDSLKIRNAIGAYSGSYCIYRALAVAASELTGHHRPDLRNTYPSAKIGPHPQWASDDKIVSLDPWGHMVVEVFAEQLKQNLDVRPTIAITKAHMKLPEIADAVKSNQLKIDGRVVLDAEGELNVVKAAVDPVWYLPGVAKRFNVEENTLRRVLFEDTGGMYPELITRPDLKVFLPPIGGLSVYFFGKIEYLTDVSKELTLRVHDECNGSDVFGSDICTCRPYLTHGLVECARTAQNGGVGVIVYFRKEGRCLGEVTKYLVYNARKRAEGGDTAASYFERTEIIAGVKDMRFQVLMPDVLHWLGIKKIHKFISMSNMKYDAIVSSGIPIIERVAIPDELIPADSRVEIDAKIAAGYFTAGKVPTNADLVQVKGRQWEDIPH